MSYPLNISWSDGQTVHASDLNTIDAAINADTEAIAANRVVDRTDGTATTASI